MGRMLLVAAGLVCLVVLAAALSCGPDLGEVPFLCHAAPPPCPDGYVCKATKPPGYCVKEGTCPSTVPGCTTPETCGNGVCDVGEDRDNCAQDCKADACGDDKCDAAAGETAKTCPKDCHCGDGTCGPAETPENCPVDCPVSTCGDKQCVPPETHQSCPADCPATCGDGTCDLGETSQTCPKDCPAAVCGNTKCEAGETPTSCPVDCGTTCTANTTQCEGTDKLKSCVGGTWKTDDCNALCTAGGYNYSTGCTYSTTQKKDLCQCGKYVTFGGVCDDKKKCDPSLICVVFGTSPTGFCTKYCTTACSGAPGGSLATCGVNVGGKKACVFECDFLIDCPITLTCDYYDGICKP